MNSPTSRGKGKLRDADVEQIAQGCDEALLVDVHHSTFILPLKFRKLNYRHVQQLENRSVTQSSLSTTGRPLKLPQDNRCSW
jgi:hypothetical protein